VIVVGLALAVTILIPIIDLTLLFSVDKSIEGYIEIVVGRVMLVVALLLFAALSFGVSFIEDWINIKKHGSIEQYESWQSINFDVR
ncbi:MAG: amino acid permease, partial [Mycoplasmataceae bacterium]|nr:amino acid permease [Mycoplasmataceae bacterium]